MYYASFGLLAAVIHLIINGEILFRNYGKDDFVWRRYRSFLGGVMIFYVADILWGFLFDLKNVPLLYTDTTVFFLAMGLSLFLWMRFIVSYVNRKSITSKILVYSVWALFLMETVTLIINLFRPIMFSFDETGEYFPLSARYIFLGLQIILFLLISGYTLVLSVSKKGREAIHYRAIGYSGITMALFIILQSKYPFAPFYSIGCLLAVCIIHSHVEVDQRIAISHELGSVKQMAYKDPLTSVKSVNAYTEVREVFDKLIQNKEISDFGIAVFDVNDLKKVNDTKGHDEGDKYLKDSCMLICKIFKHSPVFRIGGDEFVAILEGEDYNNREALLQNFNSAVDENKKSGGPVVAGGLDTYQSETDHSFEEIFQRADARMYERKNKLKESSAGTKQ